MARMPWHISHSSCANLKWTITAPASTSGCSRRPVGFLYVARSHREDVAAAGRAERRDDDIRKFEEIGVACSHEGGNQ